MLFQQGVSEWVWAAFGQKVALDRKERSHRFLEEALELYQAMGRTREEALQLVDYVYGRPVGERKQEIGGVMVTLAALCAATNDNMDMLGDEELRRCWNNIVKIRAKNRNKPEIGPLPGAVS